MRIGIHPALKRRDGGIYQYTAAVLDSLSMWTQGRLRAAGKCTDQFVVFAHDPDEPALNALNGPAWDIKPFRPPGAPVESHEMNRQDPPEPDSPSYQPDMREWILRCGVEMMIYPSPHRLSFESRVPYIMAIHDLQHRLQPEFSEVSANGELQRREYLFRNGARSATMLIAESETGKEDILTCYGRFGVNADSIAVLPYTSFQTTRRGSADDHAKRVITEYSLPPRYVFYPAQFWPHKNHRRIVEALGLLHQDHNLDVAIVFTGSAGDDIREGTLTAVTAIGKRMGISNLINNLGYVSDEDVAGLYAAAEFMVMPTFFGPTNIPVLEAWATNCPVLTSDIRGIREQVGDAAMLVDPRSTASIADGIRRLWTDPNLRQTLIDKGRARLSDYTPGDFALRLVDIIGEAKDRVRRKNTSITAV